MSAFNTWGAAAARENNIDITQKSCGMNWIEAIVQFVVSCCFVKQSEVLCRSIYRGASSIKCVDVISPRLPLNPTCPLSPPTTRCGHGLRLLPMHNLTVPRKANQSIAWLPPPQILRSNGGGVLPYSSNKSQGYEVDQFCHLTSSSSGWIVNVSRRSQRALHSLAVIYGLKGDWCCIRVGLSCSNLIPRVFLQVISFSDLWWGLGSRRGAANLEKTVLLISGLLQTLQVSRANDISNLRKVDMNIIKAHRISY